MRVALQQSREHEHGEPEGYPKGSVVLCASCGKPLYVLDRGIGFGEKAGRAIDAFRPIRSSDLDWLLKWPRLNPGVTAAIRAMDQHGGRSDYLSKLTEPRMGDPALCPFCQGAFVFGRTAESSDTNNRAYVWELVTVTPNGRRR
jgi:hypothetical protein